MKSKQTGLPAFIIAGFEHSGTTLVSEILRQHPCLDSGFEGGLLLPKKLRDFKKFEPFFTNFKNGWEISEDDMAEICKSDSYSEAYSKSREYSKLIFDKRTDIFDKTPKYMQRLPSILNKVDGLKAVVMVRDMRSLMDSTISRSKLQIEEWIESAYPITKTHTMSYLDGLTTALMNKKLKSRVMVVRYEELVLDQENQFRAIFDFINYKFKPAYLNFAGKRHPDNVYGESIKDEYINKFKKNLPNYFIKQVIDDFDVYSNYFWEI